MEVRRRMGLILDVLMVKLDMVNLKMDMIKLLACTYFSLTLFAYFIFPFRFALPVLANDTNRISPSLSLFPPLL
jgi:hypothetical protein